MPPNNANPRAPGHALFAPIGVDVWKQDVLDFLAEHTAEGRPREDALVIFVPS